MHLYNVNIFSKQFCAYLPSPNPKTQRLYSYYNLNYNNCNYNKGAKDVEIDIVAYDSCGKDIVFGECKYSTQKKGLKTLKELQEKANAVNWNKDSRTEYFAINSKSGFTNDLVEYAKQHDNIFLKDL